MIKEMGVVSRRIIQMFKILFDDCFRLGYRLSVILPSKQEAAHCPPDSEPTEQLLACQCEEGLVPNGNKCGNLSLFSSLFLCNNSTWCFFFSANYRASLQWYWFHSTKHNRIDNKRLYQMVWSRIREVNTWWLLYLQTWGICRFQ